MQNQLSEPEDLMLQNATPLRSLVCRGFGRLLGQGRNHDFHLVSGKCFYSQAYSNINIYICVCMSVCLSVGRSVCLSVCMYVCVYIYIVYINIYCVYIHIYIYIFPQNLPSLAKRLLELELAQVVARLKPGTATPFENMCISLYSVILCKIYVLYVYSDMCIS